MALWKSLFTPSHLLEAAGAVLLWCWKEYKPELLAFFKRCCTRLFRQDIARRVTETELKEILDSGLVGLETLLLLLLKEYAADRVTVMEYSEKDGSHFATCVVEVREAEMYSVQALYQNAKLPPGLWPALEHVHSQPGRWRYVPDARLEDNVPMRAALLSSAVASAYYLSFPSPDGHPKAMLALSWAREHLLTDAQLSALKKSGIACGYVWQLMAAIRPTSTD
jgi:hypothetical protein